MAYRLADTLAAHGAAEPLDIDAAMQAIALPTSPSRGTVCCAVPVLLTLPQFDIEPTGRLII